MAPSKLARVVGQASPKNLPVRVTNSNRHDGDASAELRIVQLAAKALKQRNKSVRGSRVLLVGTFGDRVLDRLRAQGAIVAYYDPLASYAGSEHASNSVQRRRRSDYSNERRGNFGDGAHQAAGERRYAGCQRYIRRGDDGLRSAALTEEELARADCLILATAHPAVDYDLIVRAADIILDTHDALTYELCRSARGIVVRREQR